jgi:hypothetical protein
MSDSPDLNIGIMFASFSSLGKEPCSSDRFTICVSIALKGVLFSLKIDAGKLSQPTAQFLRLSMILLISSSVVGLRNRFYIFWNKMKGTYVGFWNFVVKSEANVCKETIKAIGDLLWVVY